MAVAQPSQLTFKFKDRKGACGFPGCPQELFRHGYCQGHARQLLRGQALVPLRSIRWTFQEEQQLRELYRLAGNGKVNLASAAEKFERRSRFAIELKASELGLTNIHRKWHVPKRKYATNEERSAAMSVRRSQWIKDHGHPRGALGMKHSDQTKKAISEKSRLSWASLTNKQKVARSIKITQTRVKNGHPYGPHGSWLAGWRIIGDQRVYFRSRWEANYARYLEWLKSIGNIKQWEHEPQTFWFGKIRRGTVSYLPDFRITNPNGSLEYHEVKGWMDSRSKTKIKRMKKYYPELKLLVINATAYKKLASQVKNFIEGWEYDSKKRV